MKPKEGTTGGREREARGFNQKKIMAARNGPSNAAGAVILLLKAPAPAPPSNGPFPVSDGADGLVVVSLGLESHFSPPFPSHLTAVVMLLAAGTTVVLPPRVVVTYWVVGMAVVMRLVDVYVTYSVEPSL